MERLQFILVLGLLGFAGCRATTSTECVDPARTAPDCETSDFTSTPEAVDPNSVVQDAAPKVGSPLTFSDVTSNSVTVNWGVASDDITPALELKYKVLRGASMAEVKNPTRVRVSQDWTPNLTTFKVTRLSSGTKYYFLVLVKDAEGNTSYYEPNSVTLQAVSSGPSIEQASPEP